MSFDAIGFSALLLIAVSAVVLSVTAVMALSRVSKREFSPCRITDKQLEVVHDGLRPLMLAKVSTMVLSCTMLLTLVMFMVERHSRGIIPPGASFYSAEL